MKRTVDSINYSFVPNHTVTMEALSIARLSGREFRIVLFIMRQTNGYLREEDQISPDYFARKTGIDKPNLSHSLARLIKLNIVRRAAGTSPPTYSVTHPSYWDRSIFVKNDEISSSNLTNVLVKNDEKSYHSIDNLKKTDYRDIDIGRDPDKYIRGKYGHMVQR